MHRVAIVIGSLVYITVLLILAFSLVAVCSPIHQPFLGSTDKIATDMSVSKFIVNGDVSLIQNFTEDEQDHLKDVNRLVHKTLFFLAGLIAVLVFIWSNITSTQRTTILLSPLLFLMISIIPLIGMFSKFTSSFIGFHEIFFPQGNYVFSQSSLLIQTYPESFFSTMAGLAVWIYLVLFLIILFAFSWGDDWKKTLARRKKEKFEEWKLRVNEHNGVIIRRARVEDARDIKHLTQKNNVKRDSKRKTAFVEFKIPTIKEYEHFIKEDEHIYVAEKNDKVIGFATCYTQEFMKEHYIQEKVKNFLHKKFHNFYFMEQIAVQQYYRKKGIAKALFHRMLTDIKVENKASLISGISHHPKKDEVMEHFLLKHGFNWKGDLFTDKKLAYGIYEKPLVEEKDKKK